MAGRSTDRPTRRFASVGEITEAAELLDVTFLEVSGRRLFDQQEDREEAESRTTLLTWLRERDGGTVLEVRCRLELAGTQADFAVDATAAFSVGEPFELAEDLQRQFIEQIGVTVLYPYLRESLHSTATRLGVDTPMLSLRNPWQPTK
ncbi:MULTISPECIES: hypothetical protein [unclassified Kitasatospora]|uniref:hypothetical protein n=1 Tax=unclassified Kitasatospora TaxID=2633591 RepID=UPI000670C261|nr:hypothetical protein [Kitasatospora sp. MY 5-36]